MREPRTQTTNFVVDETIKLSDPNKWNVTTRTWELSDDTKKEIRSIEENRELSMLALRRHFS